MTDKLVDKIKLFKAEPVRFVTDVIGAIPDPCQAEILNSIAKNPRTTIRSGHGVGKSTVGAWAVSWFLMCFPHPKVPCTAPTEHQLKDILWAELAKWINNSPLKDALCWTQERVFMRGHPATWFAVARTAAKPDALQGFHAKHILYVLDEASGISDALFEPVLGALSTEGAKLLMMGNPTSTTGFFADSHMSRRALYNALKVDGRDSPRVSKESVQLIVDLFGEDSDPFRVRVAGEFPKAMPDGFIPLDWIEKSETTEIKEPAASIDIGVDVARFGDDDSIIAEMYDENYARVTKRMHGNDTMQVTGAVVERLRFLNGKYANVTPDVKVDCDGLGVGVYDRLKELLAEGKFRARLHECHFGGAGGKLNSGDPLAFFNNTGLMWGTVREKLRTGTLKLYKDNELTAQLSSRKYSLNSDGKIVLERKEDMKKRKVKSPDRGDAVALAAWKRRRAIAIFS